MQRAPQLQRTERKTRHALEILAEVPYNEMELGKVYRLERTGELVKWTMVNCKGKQIRRLKRLCNTCEKNGRVPREANYKDGDGKFTKCAHCAREAGTYEPSSICQVCGQRGSSYPTGPGTKGRSLCTGCARTQKIDVFTDTTCFLKNTYKTIEARKDKYGGDLMSFEDFYDIYKSQNGVCALSGKQFDLSSRMDQPSPDRIDSTRGYSKDNVFFTTFGVNRARQDLSLDNFVQMCKMVVSHSSYSSHALDTLNTTNPIPSPTDTAPTGPASDKHFPPKKRMRVN